MKKYIRTTNNKIYDLSKYADLKENETSYFIRNKEYKPNSKIISKAFKYKVYFCKNDIVKESDDILDLIQAGDLYFYNINLTDRKVENQFDILDLTFDKDIVLAKLRVGQIELTKLYTKQDDNYILAWNKERGVM